MNKFNYQWYLKDNYKIDTIVKNNLNVFGTFICGGGSTMGYKLAGYNHLGGIEIDKKIAAVYQLNHNPKYLYCEDIRQFNCRNDLPNELYNLDILDGSPPCSTFSTCGSREKAWGKEKRFKEGQALQTLDDLVFVYCDTVIKLKPKVFILENVSGILKGNAKSYAKAIVEKMTTANYVVQVFQLNAATMGVPQKRERVFFIGYKKELQFNKLILNFDIPIISFRVLDDGIISNFEKIDNYKASLWDICIIGKALSSVHPKKHYFNSIKINPNDACCTIASGSYLYHWQQKRKLTKTELIKIGTFPLDYNFDNISPIYLIGMSVPPVMTAQIAYQIYLQWFKNDLVC